MRTWLNRVLPKALAALWPGQAQFYLAECLAFMEAASEPKADLNWEGGK